MTTPNEGSAGATPAPEVVAAAVAAAGLAQAPAVTERQKHMQTVGVRYIGNKKEKTDNVCGTDAVWDGFGSVRQVPVEVARKLCSYRYAAVWQFESEDPPADPTDASKSKKAAAVALKAVTKHKEALERRAPPKQESAFDSVEPDRIMEAIGELAGAADAPDHFTPEGPPKIESVRALLGKKISPFALTAAWDLIQAESAR